jgi:PAS domain S-box-containing protein
VQAKAELRARDELLRMAVSGAPILLFLIDRQGFLRVSMGRHMARETSQEPIIGRSIYDLYGDNPKVTANFERALTGVSFQDLVEIDRHFYLIYYEPVRNTSGVITGVIGTSLDISDNKRLQKELYERIQELRLLEVDLQQRVEERKRVLELLNDSEEALRLSEQRFRTIFQSADIGIELVDMDGRLMACNPSIARIFGYDEQELLETAIGKTDHPINITFQDHKFKRLQAGQLDHYTLERAYQHHSGQVIWCVSTVSLVRDMNNTPQYAICMITDETEMREVQRRLAVGREEERNFLARELHDGPIQDLYGLSYTLRAFVDRLPSEIEKRPVDDILADVQKVVHTLRTISSELRPPSLAPFGLEKAIRSHAQQFRDAHPELRVSLDLLPDGQRLPSNIRLALFRIYQASLANVLRHAQATRVDILLEVDDEQVRLEIRDDGKGFVMPARWIQLARNGHLGIVGAIERAESIGGTLEIISAPEQGTRVYVRVPLSNLNGQKSHSTGESYG